MNIKKFNLLYVFLFILLLMPHNFIGDDYSSSIAAILCIIVLIIYVKDTKINLPYFYLITAFILSGLVTMFFSHNITKSFSGILIYFVAAISYIIFKRFSLESNNIIKFITYVISASSFCFIIVQGSIFNIRIYGNIGYANTYALILLITLYLNETCQSNKLYDFIQLILLLGILFTSSRNTLVYLIIFFIIKIINERKNDYKLKSLFNFMMALLTYISINIFGPGIILLLPVILFSIYYFISKIVPDSLDGITSVLVVLGIPSMFWLKIGFVQRLENISTKLGVFQERLVYYEDVVKALIKHPFGFGINSFEYSQYSIQSAFYDVRYVHNSFLQVGYDCGIVGIMIFVLIAVLGLILIIKSSDKRKKYFIPLYLTIYLHSLLDFDFSFVIIPIIISMLVAFSHNENDKKINPFIAKPVSIAVLLLSLYLFSVQTIYFMGDRFVSTGNYNIGKTFYTINKYITFKDSDPYFKLAAIYKKLSESNVNDKTALLNLCIENLKIAEKINPEDPRIIGNIAFAYKSLNNINKTIEYYDKYFTVERYYSVMYESYYDYLYGLIEKTNNLTYSDKINNLIDLYSQNYKSLNSKAKYLKNQLTPTLGLK